MKSIEVAGKSIEEAKQAALEQLGVAEAEVEFEVLKRPGAVAGLFGGGEYRLRATVTAEAKGEEVAAIAETAPEAAEPAQAPEAIEEPETQPSGARAQVCQEIAERAQQIATDLVRFIGIENAEVIITDTSDREVALEIQADNAGLLIGRHGETLDALQLIVAIGANKGFEDGVRVILDTENYRQRHLETLESMAQSYAQEVKAKGEEVVIPDLKAYERRVVHMALRDDPEVKTYSEGEGRDRVLVISPVRR